MKFTNLEIQKSEVKRMKKVKNLIKIIMEIIIVMIIIRTREIGNKSKSKHKKYKQLMAINRIMR